MKNSYLTITDQFCGAGGSSEGVVQCAKRLKLNNGLKVKMALNHWALAIETHNTNHPDTDHDCTDISACDPRRYPSTTILITSPECTNHSLAKGQKRKTAPLFQTIDPTVERSRATMWDVPRFAEYHSYELIIVENVVDARYWVMYHAWLTAMHALGYDHEAVYLNSMHAHPTPQSRDRMYVVFWKKGNKKPDLAVRPQAYCNHCAKNTEAYQAWKKSGVNWGKYKQQYIFRCPSCNHQVEPYYYAAFNCIDWSLPGTRIADRKKPLSENTMKRIQYGIEKYWNNPQIITTRYTSGIGSRVRNAVNDTLPTQPGDQSHAILNPLLVSTVYGPTARAQCRSIEDPLRTQTSLNELNPLIMNGEYASDRKKVRDATNEVGFTQTTRATNAVVMPFLVKNYGGNFDPKHAPIDSTDPLATLTTSDHHALVNAQKPGVISHESFKAFLSYYYNGSDIASDIRGAARTFSTRDRVSLVVAGERPKIEDCYYRMLVPHEVQLGMAFRHDYIVKGNSREQVKQLGNAVTPPAMDFLVERCVETLL